MADSDKQQEQPFEEVLGELEATVERLERGNLPLEESLAAFERGMKLAASADRTLSAAEARVEALVTGADGESETVPFEEAFPGVDLDPSGR